MTKGANAASVSDPPSAVHASFLQPDGHLHSASSPDDGAASILTSRSVRLPLKVADKEVKFEAQAFRSSKTGEEAIALVRRSSASSARAIPIVRVHSGCVTGDIFHSLRCDCHEQLQRSLRIISEADFGIIVYLPAHEGRGIGLFRKLEAYALQERGLDTVDANIKLGAPVDGRDYALAAAVLREIGVDRIRLLTNNPCKEQALSGHRIAVVERIPLAVTPNVHNARYLKTKRDRLSHKAWEDQR